MAFHPSTNGTVEQTNALVEQHLRCYVNYQQTNWAELLQFVEVVYNNAVHSSTGLTSFKVVNGVEFVPIPEYPQKAPSSVSLAKWIKTLPRVWGNVKQALIKPAETQKTHADKKRSPQMPFHVGEKVYLSSKYLKLKVPCWKLGP